MHVRTFTYISDAKVDMLLDQIPSGVKQTIAAELGFNFGLFSGKVGSEKQTLETRVQRLLAVEQHLRQAETLGTPAAPASWIEGVMSMSWIDAGAGCLLCIGGDDTRLLALAGSMKHIAGAAAPEATPIPFSFFPSIAAHLTAMTEKKLTQLDGLHGRLLDVALAPGLSQGAMGWAEALTWLRASQATVSQDVRFIARRLVQQSCAGIDVLLASPLFVELVE